MRTLDIETYDPHLKTKGDGSKRGDGYITCISSYDMNTKKAQSWRRKEDVPAEVWNDDKIILHNGVYDLAWLGEHKGNYADTLVRESLIAPDLMGKKIYSLQKSCERRGVVGKDRSSIDTWWAEHGGKGDAIEHNDVIPFEVQAQYCEQDCKATADLYAAQQPIIDDLKLNSIDEVESGLLNVIMRMKHNGIRIDERQRDYYAHQWKVQVVELEDEILMESGIVNINSPAQIAHYFHNEGIVSKFKTETGAESWDKDSMNALSHPVAEKIVKARTLSKVLSTYLEGGLCETVDGRLYTTLYPTMRDDGGTITGRFSSAHPNLQNIPSSKDKGGKELRSLVLPDEGMTLGAYDYKQIEYRLFAHFAILFKMPGWEKLRDAMAAGADYHKFVLNMLCWNDDMRRLAKTLNFGVLYGMGKKTCVQKNYKLFKPPTGQTVEQYADWVYDTYFTALPFVKPTCKKIERIASQQGYARSVGGRRHIYPLGRGYAIVNYLIQGSAADLLKIGLVEAEKAGIWDVLKLHLTVHDENVFSIPEGKLGREACKELEQCMITKMRFNVPIGVDCEEGTNWSNVA